MSDSNRSPFSFPLGVFEPSCEIFSVAVGAFEEARTKARSHQEGRERNKEDGGIEEEMKGLSGRGFGESHDELFE